VECQKSESGELFATVPEAGTRMGARVGQTDPQRSGDISTKVRIKLRKAERLEAKYHELLGAYRVAHARVQTIEPFEASLRENTPLTSINDPGALLEYLNQMTLKSDMVLDELKRVAAERDNYRKKFDESKQESQSLKDGISKLNQQQPISEPAAELQKSPPLLSDLSIARKSASGTATGSTTSAKSRIPPTSSPTPSVSLFSPKSQALKSPQEEKETGEEIFSYDNELPLLEAELRERVAEISDLKEQASTLRGDLSVARESTEGMVQSLEAATRELHALRDVNENHDSARKELQMKLESLEQKVKCLTSHRTVVTQEDCTLGYQMMEGKAVLKERDASLSSGVKITEQTKVELKSLESQTTDFGEKVAQKVATKDLEDSLAMAQLADLQQQKQSDSESASQKQIGILNDVMESLRSQLRMAEGQITELKQVKKRADAEIEDLLQLKARSEGQAEARSQVNDESIDRYEAHIAEQPSTKYFGFVNNEEFSLSGDPPDAMRQFSEIVKNSRPKLYEALMFPEKSKEKSTASSETPNAPKDATKKSKKKKKKNKGGQSSTAEQAIHDPPAKVTETLDEAGEEAPRLIVPHSPHLEKQVSDLKNQIEEKDATIDSLSARLKDQEMLNEEVETLRDDLLHQGEGHVEAREALKVASLEKAGLEDHIAFAQKELADLKAHSVAHSAEWEKSHRGVLADFEALKTKFDSSQSDLAAAERLAAARFKDVTDLRELLSKAQLEARNLRSEVEELMPTKEDLKNKIGELTRLESRHEDLKANIKSVSGKIGEKDVEIKDMRQKLSSGSSARMKAEQDLRTIRTHLEKAETAKEAALITQKLASEEISKMKAELSTERSRNRELQEAVSKHVKEAESLKEGIGLKTSLHDSTQALVAGLREQTIELSTQAREASSRADSLEEELAEAQRMLFERGREGETMRRLLSDAEGRTSTMIREMTERMETAIEERDRVEDEASVSNRRMTREVEDLRNKAKEATRSLKATQEEKEDLERSQRDLRRISEDLKAAEERALAKVAEIQAALRQLREALDQREKEGKQLERQRADMKHMLEEVEERAERLQKANRGLTDELKSFQNGDKVIVHPPPTGPPQPDMPSPRSSTDSAVPNARESSVVGSSVPNMQARPPGSRSSTASGPNAPTTDYVYLKNVLLQFLEQKDKNHQKQLIPVLKTLLNFDRYADSPPNLTQKETKGYVAGMSRDGWRQS
jgi:chromosome segregation ATPase